MLLENRLLTFLTGLIGFANRIYQGTEQVRIIFFQVRWNCKLAEQDKPIYQPNKTAYQKNCYTNIIGITFTGNFLNND